MVVQDYQPQTSLVVVVEGFPKMVHRKGTAGTEELQTLLELM